VALCPCGRQRDYAECDCVFVSLSYIALVSYWCETKVYFFVYVTLPIKTHRSRLYTMLLQHVPLFEMNGLYINIYRSVLTLSCSIGNDLIDDCFLVRMVNCMFVTYYPCSSRWMLSLSVLDTKENNLSVIMYACKRIRKEVG
jgi:hypothetical protein